MITRTLGLLIAAIVSLTTADESGDLVEIHATITLERPDGKSEVVSEPRMIIALGEWGVVEDSSDNFVPTEWSPLSIPSELADAAVVDDPDHATARFETNDKQLVVPPQPGKLEKKKQGWEVKFRPRLHSTGKVAIDCRIDHALFLGFVNESNPVRITRKGALGGKGKEIVLDENNQAQYQFAKWEKKLVFLPAETGHVPKVESASLSPDDVKETTVPQIQVRLTATRLAKREAKRTKLKKPVVYLTTRFVEVSDDTAPPEIMGSKILTDPQFQMTIRALNQKKGVDLLSGPSVMTPSGTAAKVEVLREMIYPTKYNPVEISSEEDGGFAATPAAPTDFETRNTGVSASLTPRILSDGRIELTFEPVVTEFEAFRNYGKPVMKVDPKRPAKRNEIVVTENRIETPIFAEQHAKTTVRMADGETLMFGGLTREEIQDVEDKVPFLGDLPLIGKAARSQTELHIRRKLYFFVTAKLVESE